MKPTFRKRYIGPGYWIERHPAEFCYSDWNFDPANARRYGSLFGWYKAPLDMDDLMKAFYEICRARELNPITSNVYFSPGRPGIYDFLMQPERPPQQEITLHAQPQPDPLRGHHRDDILRLPLGAAVREDCSANRFFPEDLPPDV